jgi:hypothetical protein
MIQAAEFRLVQAQAAVFTPGLELRTARVLAKLLTAFGQLFDGEPQLLDLPVPSPAELPRITLKSSNERWLLVVSPARVDVVHRTPEPEEGPVGLNEFLDQALEIFGQYQEATAARIGRLACVITRFAISPNAAQEVARHFCREEWLRGPLNRPSDFELHAAKQFDLRPGLRINSWFRCRAGKITVRDQPPQPAASVEQDFNTLQEEYESRDFTAAQREEFFRAAPAELDHILEMYFPAGA